MPMTCGQALVRLLEEHGVDTVFGIPGVHTLELYRGLAGSGIRHVLVRHEQGAGFMADGYARASGRPGVCFVITGPGVTNIATPIGQAFSDSVPMLVVSTVNARGTLGRGEGRLHEITDQAAVTRPLCGFQATARSAGEVGDLVNLAFSRLRSQRPRPAHVEVPIDVLAEPVAAPFAFRAPASPPQAGDDALAAAAALLEGAERPAIVIGGGARHCGASVRALADRLGAPVATTVAAKGAVPDDWPLSLSSTLSSPATLRWLAEADIVLLAGTELAETDHWHDRPALAGKVIRIDVDPAKLADPAAAVGILGEAGDALDRLARRVKPGPAASRGNEAPALVARLRAEAQADARPLRRQHLRVLDTLRAALPPEAIVATDMTQIAYTGNTAFPASLPGRWLHPSGYGTLGYAMPAAVGAKLACPDAPVVALAGDAGFLFTVQDLATAAELGLPLPIVLWNNDALGQIRDDMDRSGIPPVGVVGRNPDFGLLAKAFGCAFRTPGSLEAIAADLAEARRADRPTVIEVRQDAGYLA